MICSGEYDPKYQGVIDTDPISTFPQNSPSRWTILVDSLIIGQNQISVKTAVASAPGNKAVALLDSGTSYTLVPIAYKLFERCSLYFVVMLLLKFATRYMGVFKVLIITPFWDNGSYLVTLRSTWLFRLSQFCISRASISLP